MSDRNSYDKMSLDEFRSQLLGDIEGFHENIKALSAKYGVDRSYPEWYETLAAWVEVGTDSENMMYGKL